MAMQTDWRDTRILGLQREVSRLKGQNELLQERLDRMDKVFVEVQEENSRLKCDIARVKCESAAKINGLMKDISDMVPVLEEANNNLAAKDAEIAELRAHLSPKAEEKVCHNPILQSSIGYAVCDDDGLCRDGNGELHHATCKYGAQWHYQLPPIPCPNCGTPLVAFGREANKFSLGCRNCAFDRVDNVLPPVVEPAAPVADEHSLLKAVQAELDAAKEELMRADAPPVIPDVARGAAKQDAEALAFDNSPRARALAGKCPVCGSARTTEDKSGKINGYYLILCGKCGIVRLREAVR